MPWHGTEPLTGRFMARHGNEHLGMENLGTARPAKCWYGKSMARHGTKNHAINCFHWKAAAPQTPCCSWGASSPPNPLAGGLAAPHAPPAFREAPPLGLSFFFWYQDLGTNILVLRSLGEPVPRVTGTALSAAPDRCPFFTVRTPQGTLVGENEHYQNENLCCQKCLQCPD